MKYKPVLKWAGGKRSILNLIENRLEKLDTQNATFFDLFAGSGSVAFHVADMFDHIVINDTNEELYNLYTVIKDDPISLIGNLEKLKSSHSKDQYYEIREWDRSSEYKKIHKSDERAARTIYLNKTCYNGLYRVNSKGQFNVPIGRYENPKINDFKNIQTLSDILKLKFTICNSDFSHLKKHLKTGDVVYLDPPYDKENSSSFVSYTSKKFDVYDQERLKDFFDELTDMGVYACLSNSATEKIKDLYKEYIDDDSYITVQRNISSKGDSRIRAEEILIDNFNFIKEKAKCL
ncbi:DNA adenine methylase [Candidatus Xianfuyuplasma coldseepsis]|uniref:Site-specific DNA-methyltransferase (adenine-specific) n=1 Tax=Candidatus Xianfuyuplasma coldseepsis TaxID=2782163 RepID=A0A7L7KQZ9_9MOLU|nr:Dam family site-specific DNA-(adenine-N6)-methyltransferase [Xianfuyuplasma coldseepsis]QMS85107.1 Dam family site-specific DNA-(adenine-N6)-methyltransferase [Xianfuyuplasma coldseepsis]